MNKKSGAGAKELLSGGAVVVFGTLVGAVANYLFQRYMANHLGAEQYGELAALLNLLILFTVPAAVIQMVAGRHGGELAAEHGSAGISQLTRWLLLKLWPVAIGLALLVAAISPAIARYLNFPTVWPVVALTPTILLGLLLPVLRGALQGSRRFGLYAWSTTAEGIFRFLGGLLVGALGYGLFGAIGAVIVGMIIALLFSLSPLKITSGASKLNLHITGREYAFISVVLLISSLYLSADVLLVKHFFPLDSDLVGQYAAASMVAKYIFYFTSPLIAVMFPLLIARRLNGQRSLPMLLATLIAIGLAGACALAIFAVWPTGILRVLVGPDYTASAPLLLLLGLYVLLYELLFLFLQYFLAMRDEGFAVWLVLGAFGYMIAGWLWHDSLHQLVLALTTSLAVANALLIGYGGIKYRGAK